MTNPKIVLPKSTYPLHQAIMNHDHERVRDLLKNHADLFQKNQNQKTPLDYAMEYGTPEIKKLIREYINQADTDNKTMLHYAALNGNSEQVKQLLKCGADMHAEDKDKFTPLEYAMEFVDLIPRYAGVVKTLINCCDEKNITPLHHAALKGKTYTVAALIEHGADLNAKDIKGNRPYDYAAAGLKMRLELVREKMHEKKLDPAKGIPKAYKDALLKDHMDILETLKKAAPQKKEEKSHARLFDPVTELLSTEVKKEKPKNKLGRS